MFAVFWKSYGYTGLKADTIPLQRHKMPVIPCLLFQMVIYATFREKPVKTRLNALC